MKHQNQDTRFKDRVTSVDPQGLNKLQSITEQTYDARQVFVVMMGLYSDSVLPELPQIEFAILQVWTQLSVVYTQELGNRTIDNYSAVLVYKGIQSEEKRRELFQFLTKYFLEKKESVFSLTVQMPAQVSRG